MRALFNALWADESGQDLTEYVLLVVVIALGVAVAVAALQGEISNVFNRAVTTLQSY